MGDGVLAFVGAVFGAAVTAALAEILRRQRERARALLVIRSQVRTIHEAVEALGKGDVPRRAFEVEARLSGFTLDSAALGDIPPNVVRIVEAMRASVTNTIRAAAPVLSHVRSLSSGIPINHFKAFEDSIEPLRASVETAIAALDKARGELGPASE